MTQHTEGSLAAEKVKQFKSILRQGENFEELFDCLPDVCFFVKGKDYKLLMCNDANRRLLKLKTKLDIVGKSEYDFFPKNLADKIHQDDILVMEKEEAVINRIELILDESGVLVWVSTNKLPLYDNDDLVIGLMGTTRILKHADMIPESHQPFITTIQYIKENYSKHIDVKELAKMNNLSDSRFRTKFRNLFSLSPQKFILKIRIQAACHELTTTDNTIAEVALDCGFCDQSYFTMQFKSMIGMTPKKYRQAWARKK